MSASYGLATRNARVRAGALLVNAPLTQRNPTLRVLIGAEIEWTANRAPTAGEVGVDNLLQARFDARIRG